MISICFFMRNIPNKVKDHDVYVTGRLQELGALSVSLTVKPVS